MWNPFRRKQGKEKALQQPVSRGGWSPLFGFMHEPFAGAWQRNLEINQDTVLSYYAVFACISLIASDIAKMPPRLMRRDSKGVMQEVRTGDIPALYKRPNAFQNRIQFFEHWLNSKLCHGNTVALKIRNNAGKITELRLLDWNKVTPLVADDGSVFYQINPDSMAGIESSVTVPAREVIHDRFNCLFHPLIGLSPIYAAGLAAMQGHHIQENSAYFFRNGGKPSGVIEVPGTLTEENARKIKDNWDSGYSGENAGKTAILSNGAKYNPTTVSAVDAQTVEQLSMTAQIICSVFHVPAYKVGIGELPTHDNIEAQDQQYYSQCLQSLIESIELLLDEAFGLEGDSGTEFDVNALLRMDSERRIKSLGEGVKNTILTPNEARRSENLPPLPGGDALYLQQQNFSLEALARRDASDDPFAKSGAGSSTTSDDVNGKSMSESELIAAKAMLRGLLTK
ncbi:TPA: phage portal protein [Citrobacter farmeri]|nr:phage portal protein [Citrobacter farmeri]